LKFNVVSAGPVRQQIPASSTQPMKRPSSWLPEGNPGLRFWILLGMGTWTLQWVFRRNNEQWWLKEEEGMKNILSYL